MLTNTKKIGTINILNEEIVITDPIFHSNSRWARQLGLLKSGMWEVHTSDDGIILVHESHVKKVPRRNKIKKSLGGVINDSKLMSIFDNKIYSNGKFYNHESNPEEQTDKMLKESKLLKESSQDELFFNNGFIFKVNYKKANVFTYKHKHDVILIYIEGE